MASVQGVQGCRGFSYSSCKKIEMNLYIGNRKRVQTLHTLHREVNFVYSSRQIGVQYFVHSSAQIDLQDFVSPVKQIGLLNLFRRLNKISWCDGCDGLTGFYYSSCKKTGMNLYI